MCKILDCVNNHSLALKLLSRKISVKFCQLSIASVILFSRAMYIWINLRVRIDDGNIEFPINPLSIGDGIRKNENGRNSIISDMGKVVNSINDLIKAAYRDVEYSLDYSYHYWCERAIVKPRNTSATEINKIILEKLEGKPKQFALLLLLLKLLRASIIHKNFWNTLNLRVFLI